MFVGHLAVALGAKKIEPRLSLPALTTAAFGLDVLWPLFVIDGLEVVRIDPGNTKFTPLDFVSYPWSHSLAMSLVWGLLTAGVTFAVLRQTRAAVVMAVVVVSHWVLDWVSHRPDMPLWPDGPKLGLGLWNSIAGTFAVEGALFAMGIAVYLRATRARDAVGRWAFVALVMVTSAAWLSGPFTPPPPSVTALTTMSVMLIGVFLLWSAWIDRHRSANSEF